MLIKLKQNIKNIFRLNLFLSSIICFYRNYFQVRRSKFGYIHESSTIRFPILIKGIENVFLYDHTHILGNSLIISTKAKFIMKKNSASAEGLTIITGSHPSFVGEYFLEKAKNDIQEARDVIIEEDVWLAANVTILPGVIIGRGSIIGAGSVCRSQIPPYAIVIGNPAKVIGFKFTPEEIIKHEIMLYKIDDRIDFETLTFNYNKYFLSKLQSIKSYLN
jgi:acetyltransferase-like isoleucine patch superfamily enzyme